MTAYNYATPKASAHRMLTRYGQTVTLSRHTIGSYDPSTGSSTDTVTTQTATGIIFEWGRNSSSPSYGESNIDTSLILSGDKQLYLSPTGITTPIVNDTITDVNGKSYTIIVVKELAPAGVTILIECNIRGV